MLAIKRQEQVAYQAMLNDPALRRQVKEMKRQKGESKEEKRERKRREKEVRLRITPWGPSFRRTTRRKLTSRRPGADIARGLVCRKRRPPRRKRNIPVIRIIITIDTTADPVIRTTTMVRGRTNEIGIIIDVPNDRVRGRGPRLPVEETIGIETHAIGRTPRSTIRVNRIIVSVEVRMEAMGGTNGIVLGRRRIDERVADPGPGPGTGAAAGG